MKFKVINVFDGSVVCDGRVHARENDIKIDHLSCQDVVPFGIREFRHMF
jgi:hypothetical protein